MFKYRYPKKHTKTYILIANVLVVVIVGWLFSDGKLDNLIHKDMIVARWNIYKSTRILEKTPTDYNALIELGISKYVMKDYAGSLNAYERAVVAYPAGFVAWNNLGNVKRDMVNFSDAENAYLNAINVNPHYIPAYINLADLYTIWPQDQAGDKQKRKILPLLQKGVEKNPGNAQLQEALKAYVAANK